MTLLEKYRHILGKGYTRREIFFKGLRWSFINRIKTSIVQAHKKGKGVMVDIDAMIDGARYMVFGNYSNVQKGAWLSVPLLEMKKKQSDLAFL